jgi:endonuclease/exonuclease/phosphatase (EEP) superfamily protein YafD
MWQVRLGLRAPSITGLLQAAATITVIFSLATLANSWHRFLELFSHFRLQYLLVALILTLLFAALKHRRWAMLMLAITAINAIPVVPWYLAAAKAPVAVDETIHIVFANVNSGNSKTQAMLRLIEAEDPDLIVLQEVTDLWAAAMDTVQTDYPHRHVIPQLDNFGIAVYSRLPLTNIDVLSSPPLDLPSLVVRQTLGGTNVSFVTTHPIPPLGKLGFDARNEHLADIGERIAALDGPAVLIGDLNTALWGHHYKKLVADTGLKNARDGFGIIPTWPRQLPFAMIPIDQCLVSDDFAVLDIRSGPAIGSDHLPLIVTLGLVR